MRTVPLRSELRRTLTVLPESAWMSLMKEVERGDCQMNPLTVSITTNDDVSELNCLSGQSLNLFHRVLLVSVSYSH